jgi:minor histocompatibility antigen H13
MLLGSSGSGGRFRDALAMGASRSAHAALALALVLPLFVRKAVAFQVVLTGASATVAACVRTRAPAGPTETISKQDAQRFPLVGSAALLSLFALLKLLPPELVSAVLRAYLAALGALAIAQCFHPSHVVPSLHQRDCTVSLPTLPLIGRVAPSVGSIALHIASACFCAWYWHSQHWLANNVIAAALALQFVERAALERVKDGLLLLSGLFVYDCFWVFGTPVMLTVARGIDGPIKLLFPKSFAPASQLSKSDFSMLGLGDIVLPALFCAIAFRIDIVAKRSPKAGLNAHAHYFAFSAAGYVLGLVATEVSLQFFNAAQPALLYIVPAVVGAVFARAASLREALKVYRFEAEVAEADSSDSQVK